VTGNKKIKAYTSYFFDPEYKNAVCKFEMITDEGVVKNAFVEILSYDETGVECMIPPAYVLGDEFALLGGECEFSVSSNGEDFSNVY
jgi:hypothetical protein